jgi:regulatory protein
MVVRFTAGPADGNDAGQHELAPVISFSASRKAKRGEEHGRARGNHPAGSALDPVDATGSVDAGDSDDHTDGRSDTGAIEGVRLPRSGVRRGDTSDDPASVAGAISGVTSVIGRVHAAGSASSTDGAVAETSRPASPASPAPIASLARKRGGADTSVVDDDLVDELPPSIEDVENAILKKLRRRGMSEAEILAECLALDLTAHQANELLERLRELGYVDDRALAEQLRYSHYERKSQSRQVVARLMSTRKIPAEVIDEVLEDIGSDDELSAAREVAEKRASQMTSLDDATMERRLVGFLARRGYPGGVVRSVVGEIIRGRRSSVRFR